MTSPDSPSPRTEAGRRFHANEHGAACSFAATGSCALVNDGPWGKAWIAQIEAEAAQEAPAPDGLDHSHRPGIGQGEWWCGPCILQGRAYEREMTRDYSERSPSAPPSPAEPPRPDLWPGQTAPDAPSFWMIERGQSERHIPTVWWTGRSGREWTTDASEALRYESRTVAESVIAERSGVLPHQRFGRATEHAWLRAEARPPEGLDPDRLARAIDTVAPQRMWPVRGAHEVSAAEFADSIAAEYARLSARGAPE